MSEARMAKRFPKSVTDTKPQLQDVQRISSRINTKGAHLGLSYSTAETKDWTPRGARKRIRSDFSSDTTQANKPQVIK